MKLNFQLSVPITAADEVADELTSSPTHAVYLLLAAVCFINRPIRPHRRTIRSRKAIMFCYGFAAVYFNFLLFQ